MKTLNQGLGGQPGKEIFLVKSTTGNSISLK